MRDRTRNRHPIAFEARRKHKYVGLQIQFHNTLGWQGAEYSNPVAQTAGRDIGVEPRSGGRVAGPVTNDGQPPSQIRNSSECCDQQIVSLAWHHRSDRKKLHERTVAATHQRHGIVAWPHDVDAPGLDAVVSNHDPRRHLARDHNSRGSGQRSTLALAKDVSLCGIKTGFLSKRLVHQGDKRRARSERAGLGERPKGKPIENNWAALPALPTASPTRSSVARDSGTESCSRG